jgi:hypothetical protein
MSLVRPLLSSLLLAVLIACGGGNNNNPPPTTTPPPTTGGGDPCATASLEVADVSGEEPALVSDSSKSRPHVDDDPRWNVLNSLWLRQALGQRGLLLPLTAGPDRNAQDIGEVAVLQDTGDLITRANQFDLAGVALRFTRSDANYDVTRTDTAFRAAIGTRLTLQDDDTSSVDLPFTFPFFGKDQTRAFVNSDGNITFEEADTASSERSVSRFLTGAPRVAPFFADLDPSTGSGRVFLATAADGVTVTWCNVRGFDKTQTVSVQTTLLPNGNVDVRFGSGIGLKDAVVGISPGHTGQFTTADLSVGPTPGGAAALGERFSQDPDLDLVAVARKFYATHGDIFDQLVIWTDAKVVSGDTFAFETTVANEIRGIGVDIYDSSRDFGSGGRLRSMVMMDALTKYPSTPTEKFLGENNTVSVLGQESGHRWLAFLQFRDAAGRRSSALLGRAQAHWSFFMDSDASVMEGNDIDDLGGGAFKTKGAVSRYSLLDQYAMGLVGASQVPTFFYVESPTNVSPERGPEDAPEIGVTFNGTRRDVRIEDVVDAMGARQPSTSASPKVNHQAFIYIVSNGRTLDQAQVDKLDRIRRAWATFFKSATNSRMTAETRLH